MDYWISYAIYFQVPGPGIEQRTLHSKAQYYTTRSLRALFEKIMTVENEWALQVKLDWDW